MPRPKSNRPPKPKKSSVKTQKTLALSELAQRVVSYVSGVASSLRYLKNQFPPAYGDQLQPLLEDLAKCELVAVKIGHTMVDLTLKLDEGKSITTLVAAAAQLERIEGERSEPASDPCAATVEEQESAQRAHSKSHEWHGKGDEEGPYAPDCGCRNTPDQDVCAKAGCGFCMAAESQLAKVAAQSTNAAAAYQTLFGSGPETVPNQNPLSTFLVQKQAGAQAFVDASRVLWCPHGIEEGRHCERCPGLSATPINPT